MTTLPDKPLLRAEEFECARCHGVFPCADMTEEERLKELKENFGLDSPKNCSRVCDECYKIIITAGSN
jgi:hypothetical protein